MDRDEDRMLSAEGRKRTRAAAAGLRELGCRPDRILTSPLVRARETADIIAAVLPGNTRVEAVACLGPGVPQQDVVARLCRQNAGAVMLVGHMPSLAMLVAFLLSGRTDWDVHLKKASACRLSFEGRPAPGTACLEWLLQPNALAWLGRTGE